MRSFATALIALLCNSPAFAESDRFTASVNTTSLSVGDQLQITFTLNGANSARGFKAPAFQDFNVLMGPNQSSNMTIVNGSFSQSLSFTYVLQPTKEGTFKIGGAEIVSGNDRLISNPVTITVAKSGNRNTASGNSGGQGPSGVFIKAGVDKNAAFIGEAIVVTYRLYTRVQLLNYSLDKIPSLDGFWSQDVELPQQPVFHQENVDGVTYDVADIRKLVIFPQRAGNLEIDPMKGEVVARVPVKRQRNNDPFSQFFNDPFNNPFFGNAQDVKIPLASSPIRIKVNPLPSGAPSSFTGAVGKYACEVSLDKSNTVANDPVNLRIKVSGKGNIKLIDSPSIEFPPDMETYEPKESVNVNATATGVSGTKSFEFLLIPRTGGTYKIPVKSFSYFDPEQKKYIELPAPDLQLIVDKGTGNSTTTTVSVSKKSDVQLLGKDITFIKTKKPTWISDRKPFIHSTLFHVLLVLPLLIGGMVILFVRKNRRLLSDIKSVKSKRASKTALKRLSVAKSFLDKQEKDRFLDELFKALWGFAGDKLSIPVSELSKDTAAAGFRTKGISEELVNQFITTTDGCEFARFSGAVTSDLIHLYERGLEVITNMEQDIK
ncbi:MAG: BatD family protein, partial [Bacteroidota bacterium]